MTGDIVNLNKARKARDKLKKKTQASENVSKFRRTKAQKSLEEARAEKAARDLDAHQRRDLDAHQRDE